MKYLILILILTLFYGCQDPSSLDTQKDIKVIFDPNNLPPVFSVEPSVIDFGLIHPSKVYSKNIKIKNITSKLVSINSISVKNFTNLFSFETQPVLLAAKGASGDESNVNCIFTSSNPGKFDDEIIWSGYKNPQLKILSKVAAVWADDIVFGETIIGSYELKFLNIINSSNADVKITKFEIIDTSGVFINEPVVNIPFVINAKSSSNDIRISFNPKSANLFKGEIQIEAEYLNGSGEYFTDEIIILEGHGKY